MVEAVAFAFFGKLSEFLVAPIVCHISYPFCYTTNIKKLKDKIEALENMQADVKLSVHAAKRNLEVIGRDAEAWVSEVDNVKHKAGRFLEGIDNVEEGCLNKWNLKNRYLLSRKAAKQMRVVIKLQGKGNIYTKLAYPAPEPAPAPAPLPGMRSTLSQGFKGNESRTSITKEVVKALTDDQIKIIGICGMAGVGKTRMIHEVRREVKVMNLFDDVCIAVVSANPNLINIQDQLADMLGLEFKAKTNLVARADSLCNRLLSGRNLVILDDVWDGSLDLIAIGLPVRGASNQCKFLFASQSGHVCSVMGAQRNFEVQILTDQEAWHLFKEMAGNCVENNEVKPTAERVAKECGGLPLAIVIVGKALNSKKEHVWKDALEQLRKSSVTNIEGLHKIVYSRIELSYNYLESDQAKKLLLLCCQFPEDCNIPMEFLVRYGFGLHLFQDVETLAAVRNRVDSLVDKLRGCYLLISNEDDTVKLHDVVRHVCLSIASRDEPCFMVRHDYNLKHPEPFNFPSLKLLHLESTFPSIQEISGDSLEEMKELRVLSFNNIVAKPPPSSLQFLINLRTLCLEFCVLGNTISLVGGLRKLEILSFYGSGLHVLPSEIHQLSYLKLLDLRCESGPIMIPKGVISGLNKLEELYMGDYFQPLYKENRDEGYSESITDINSLPNLSTLQLRIDDHTLLLKLDAFCYEKLDRFHITESWELVKRSHYRFGRSLELYRVDPKLLLEANIIVLLKKTNYLLIQSDNMKNLVKKFNRDDFMNLKILRIYDCNQTEYLIDASGSVAENNTFCNLEILLISHLHSLKEICCGDLPASAFGRLEEIELWNLPMMQHLWRGSIRLPSLRNLRVLEMKFCHAIKGLFPEAVVKCLVQLQTVTIRGCNMLEEVVMKDIIPHEKDREIIELPRLKCLKLHILQSLRGFDPKWDAFSGAVEPLFNQQVLLPRLEILAITRLDNIVQIVGGQIHEVVFPELRVMTVTGCHKLLNLASSNSIPNGFQGFRNLSSLELKCCENLRYLLSLPMAKKLVNLQHLKVEFCNKIEEVIGRGEGDNSEIITFDEMIFPRLNSLYLEVLENLTSFCYENHDLELPLLKNVSVINCPKLKTVFRMVHINQ